LDGVTSKFLPRWPEKNLVHVHLLGLADCERHHVRKRLRRDCILVVEFGELKVRVDGQLAFNESTFSLNAVLDGYGLAYIPEDMAAPYIQKKRLVRVLADRCPPFVGYHLYYPSRRQHTAAFALLVEALRYKKS
jgi:DNA-binding transcriptional LysR family regulator